MFILETFNITVLIECDNFPFSRKGLPSQLSKIFTPNINFNELPQYIPIINIELKYYKDKDSVKVMCMV